MIRILKVIGQATRIKNDFIMFFIFNLKNDDTTAGKGFSYKDMFLNLFIGLIRKFLLTCL